jgi:hypothetical protein
MGEPFIFAICGVTVAVKPETPEPLIIHSDQKFVNWKEDQRTLIILDMF